VQIRPEKESEFSVIYDLIKTAFESAPVSDGSEQDFADKLRAGDGYIPELAMVVEDDNGEIIGHIMLTKMPVKTAEGVYEALLLAPISVILEHRGKGIGTQMIEVVFAKARDMGFGAVILAGDPGYYERFGFKTSTEFGIKNTNGFPDENMMLCELVSGALSGVSGTIHFEL
jgi:putative acetyltransferase